MTFSRPPVATKPLNEDRGSTLARMLDFKAAVVSEHLESTRAAAPETCGVAMEVPLK